MTTSTLSAPNLSGMLRAGSAIEHQDAENSRFMRDLLNGDIDGAGYARYLQCLRTVYAALEDVGTELAEHKEVAAVLDPQLFRREAIDADIAFWTQGEELQYESPAANRYAERILGTRTDPKLYIAHHYTRYLGDLSGGQAIGRILTRHHGLVTADGVQFYAFPAVPKPKPYKDVYRARLDALPLSDQDKAAIVEETRLAFRLNEDIFAELSQEIAPKR